VLVRDAMLSRGAVAQNGPTTILTVGAKPGEAFAPVPWETSRDVVALLDGGRPAEARTLLLDALERYEDKSVLLYNLACAEAMLGETDEALKHLQGAIELQPDAAEWARDDHDLASLHDDPRFTELVG
jgi:tetratricopeptide (TPR) repeat protein